MSAVPEVQLSVVVPVYNQAETICANIRVIREAVAAGMDGPTEVIVVSDGSVDDTAARVLEESDERTRVLRYDRNLGKGYAVRVGALEAHGRWVAYCDADLDLDPALLPKYVRRAEEASLDFAIGSKRHPDSVVSYPTSRRVGSWVFQRLVRLLFRIDVRDTQVGMKVFRREIAEEVLPLLLVKRYAFDVELLAVSRSLGYGRIEEQPVSLDYQFTGSGVGSLAVLHALVDTAAVFYRLRILRYYQRKQRLVGRFGWTRPRLERPRVAVLTDEATMELLDYHDVELAHGDLWSAASGTNAELLAVLEPGATPASNWLSATVPFLARTEIAAVVTPALAPRGGGPRAEAAAGIRESRLGGGPQYFRFLPGNVRYVDDYPTESLLVRTAVARELLRGVEPRHAVATLSAHGFHVLYTPETTIVARPAPLFRAHLEWVADHGRSRGAVIRDRGLRGVRTTTVPPVLFTAFALAGPLLLLGGGRVRSVVLAVWLVYLGAVIAASAVAALRFRSLKVGALGIPGFVLTHLVYAVGVARGIASR